MRHLSSPKLITSEYSNFDPYVADVCLDHDLDQLVSVSKRYKETLNLSNEYSYYQRFLDYLSSNQDCDIQPLRDMLEPLPPEKFRLCIRHDMDIEPFSSLQLSRSLFEAGIQGSFYVLHTAEYYGKLEEGRFKRYSYVPAMLLAMQEKYGCEVGLHNDALWVYTRWRMDGASAMTSELQALRDEGIRIVGTAAHNSAPVYGAENFEIFSGRASLDRKLLNRDGLKIPLQSLRENDWGLAYEANYPKLIARSNKEMLNDYLSNLPVDAARNMDWMRTYLLDNPHCRWGADYNLWLVGIDTWVISGHMEFDPLFLWDVSMETVKGFLDEVKPGRKVVCHIHPFYIITPAHE